MRSGIQPVYSPLVGTLLLTCLVIATCLMVGGCGRSESREASTPSGLTTGSISGAAAINSGHTSVIVQPGDTLHGIARKYNVTVYDLMMMNSLASARIGVGQRLNLPPY